MHHHIFSCHPQQCYTAAAATVVYYIIDVNVIKVGQRASPPAWTKSMTF